MQQPDPLVNLNAIQSPKKVDTQANPITSRAYALNREQMFADFKKMLGMEYIKDFLVDSIPFFVINRARIRDVATFMRDRGYILAALYASDLLTSFELNYVFHTIPFISNSKIVIQTQIDKSVSVS